MKVSSLVFVFFLIFSKQSIASKKTWNQVLSEQNISSYEIQKGDTLSELAWKLFGNSYYWPKIWSLNNQNIKNPHWIYPKQILYFLPGSQDSLPGVYTDRPHLVASSRPLEWKDLPKQNWEWSEALDILEQKKQKSKIIFPSSQQNRIKISEWIQTQEAEVFGEILFSHEQSKFLTSGHIVQINSFKNLAVGELYTLTEEPKKISTSGRSNGYGYQDFGTVKIINFRNGYFIGQIVSSLKPIPRGIQLIQHRPKKPIPTPIEGIEKIKAKFLESSTSTQKAFGTGDFIFLDKGTEDGVALGSVFRAYYQDDPQKKEKFTNEHYLIQSTVIIVDASELHSTALILKTSQPIDSQSEFILLDDLNQLEDPLFKENGTFDPELDNTLDELDLLDDQKNISDPELDQLNQLENFDPQQSALETSDPDLDPDSSQDSELDSDDEKQFPDESNSVLDSELDETPPQPETLDSELDS